MRNAGGTKRGQVVDKPSEKSEDSRHQRVLRQCDDCGEEYDATTRVVIERISGQIRQFLCNGCRDKQARARDIQEEFRRAQSLDYMRNELRRKVIPPRFSGSRLDTFDPTGNERRLAKVRAYVDEFPDGLPRDYPSLYIASCNNGVGKTHLACSIIHGLVDRLNEHRDVCPCQFREAIRLKQAIRQGQAFGAKPSADEIYEDVSTCWLLVLDDVGKEMLTPGDAAFVSEMYYTIINERYNRGLPLVITSNLPFQDPWVDGGMTLVDLIGLASVSRLRGMCNGEVIELEGEDWR